MVYYIVYHTAYYIVYYIPGPIWQAYLSYMQCFNTRPHIGVIIFSFLPIIVIKIMDIETVLYEGLSTS